ncbi:MAG: undecaprenyl-diphosphate phosphatase [Candidatus Azobacteroides sp.]|nr:undecaprenyl-diphosphate phosphatase [Candidatus Azobacteroides sp.]
MTWFDALLLGLVQGLTEYLPVSSSGHLEIFSELFGVSGGENLMFAVLVHAATVLSTIIVFRKDILKIIKGIFRFQWNEETQYFAKIALSMIPVGIVGVFFKKYVEGFFGSGLFLVGCMLLLTAVLLIFSYYAKPREKKNISFRDAFIIGISQAIAVLPGLSRSGTTISTGLILGNKKESVARFSFLMVIIPILGEAFLELVKGDFASSETTISGFALVCGFLAALISGIVACKWMLKIVTKGKLVYFAYYCIAAGIFCIVYTYLK